MRQKPIHADQFVQLNKATGLVVIFNYDMMNATKNTMYTYM